MDKGRSICPSQLHGGDMKYFFLGGRFGQSEYHRIIINIPKGIKVLKL